MNPTTQKRQQEMCTQRAVRVRGPPVKWCVYRLGVVYGIRLGYNQNTKDSLRH